jgi:hypothetical protein
MFHGEIKGDTKADYLEEHKDVLIMWEKAETMLDEYNKLVVY